MSGRIIGHEVEPMRLRKINEEVYTVSDNIASLDRQTIRKLKAVSKTNSKKRTRINIHHSLSEPVHEMFIVHKKITYIRPHKHLKKKESLHILEGEATIVFFDEKGRIIKVMPMGNYTSGKIFYYKLPSSIYHSMIIKTDYLICQETAKGPFVKSDKYNAPWSPEENDTKAIKKYIKILSTNVFKFLKK